jgi:hypothetical protein
MPDFCCVTVSPGCKTLEYPFQADPPVRAVPEALVAASGSRRDAAGFELCHYVTVSPIQGYYGAKKSFWRWIAGC